MKHFSRIRATVQRDYPDSLFFLDPALADATIAQNDQSRAIETFLTNPSADEIDIVVQNVSLSELTKPPYKASVDFEKVYLRARHARRSATRETYVAQIDFVMRDARAERVRPGEPARSADHVLPRRPGVRGAAVDDCRTPPFSRCLTVFLLAGWLAGELTFLAPYKAGALPTARDADRRRASCSSSSTCARLYYGVARWLFLRDTRPQADASRPAAHRTPEGAPRRPAGATRVDEG